MTTETLRPNATGTVVGATVTGAGGVLHTALSDDDDATYVTLVPGDSFVVEMETTSLPALSRLKTITVRCRAEDMTGTLGDLDLQYRYTGSEPPIAVYVPDTITDLATAPQAVPYAPTAEQQTAVDQLQIVVMNLGESGHDFRVYEVYLDVVIAEAPVVDLTPVTPDPWTPSSEVTIDWGYTPGSDGGPQDRYEIRLRNVGTGSVLSDVIGLGTAGTYTTQPLVDDVSYEIDVRAAQLVNGTAHWSEWDSDVFLTDFDGPEVAVVVGPDSARARMVVAVERISDEWDTLTVERSVDNGATWSFVRGATDIPVRLAPGETGYYATVPDEAALDLAVNVDIKARIEPDQVASGADQCIVSKLTATTGYALYLTADGKLRLEVRDGSAHSATSDDPFMAGAFWVRATWNDVSNNAEFYAVPDQDALPNPWDAVGVAVPMVSVGISTNSEDLLIGAGPGGADLFVGTIHRVTVSGTIGPGAGLLDVDFTGQTRGDFEANTGQTVTGSVAESWILYDYETGNGEDTLYRARATFGEFTGAWVQTAEAEAWSSIETWLKDPANPALNLTVIISSAPVLRRARRQGVHYVTGRRGPVVTSDVRQLTEGPLTIATLDDDTADALDLILDSSVLLLQTPAPDRFRSKYITIGVTDEERPADLQGEPTRLWSLPFVEVDRPLDSGIGNVPDADLVAEPFTWADAALFTWAELLTMFDDWQDVVT